jgi:hypothetical protein
LVVVGGRFFTASQPCIASAAREQTLFTANRVAFPSSPGVACLFPSQLRHGCDVPSRGEERISLAFNVLLAGVGRLHRLQAAVGLKPLVQQSIRRF